MVFSVFAFQFLNVAFPTRAEEPNQKTIDATLVEFQAPDGRKEFYYEYVPSTFDPEKTTTLLIALHGHGSGCDQIFNGKHEEFQATNDVAAKRNAVVVSPNYGSNVSWMGPEAEKDLTLVIEHQKAKRRYDRVIVSGASMGGSSTFTFAVRRPDLVDGAVAINGTANHLEYEKFQDAISESFGGSKREALLEYKNRSAEYFPEKLIGIPISITLGSLDEVVPPDSGRRLAQILQKTGGTVLLIERSDIGHMTPYAETARAFEFVFDSLDALDASK